MTDLYQLRWGLSLSLLFLCISLFSQPSSWYRDSIYFEWGVPGTTEFQMDTRTYFEDYDEDGRPSVIISQKQNNQQEWENWRKRLFNYENGELVNLLIQYWSTDSQIWQDAKERSYEYDTEGNMLMRGIRRAPAPGMSLENHKRWTYEYGSDNNQTSLLYQTWSGTEWENTSRQIWNYNSEGQLIEQLVQLWEEGNWKNTRRRGWQYDPATGMVAMVVAQSFNELTQEWQNVRRVEYLNDAVGFWTSVRNQQWDAEGNSWINTAKETLNHSAGQLQYRQLETWQEDSWQPLYRLSYNFDGTALDVVSDRWDDNDGEWNIFNRRQMVYDDFTRPIVEHGWQVWSEPQQSWVNDTVSLRRRHFWSEQAVSTNEVTADQACKLPNPYRPGTPFHCEGLPLGEKVQLTLINMIGQTIYKEVVESRGSFSLDKKIPPGLYLFSLHSETEVFHLQKLVLTQ